MRNDWPFDDDAKRDDPLTKLRIAVVNSFNPRWYYTCAFLGTNEDTGQDWEPPWPFASAARPTEAEVRLLTSFREHHRWYWSTVWGYDMAKLDAKPLDVDSTGAATVFIKYAEGDWGYRRTSWTSGPTFVPGPPSKDRTPHKYAKAPGPLPLDQVMDLVHHVGSEYPSKDWLDWKAAHPEAFGTG
jgi:hypothetical protein